MESQSERLDSYWVEVSGWDASDNFFVEKTSLNWWDAGKKEVHLRRGLRQGSVVFVRLIQPLGYHNNFPIAYQVKRIGPHDTDGKSRVYLAQLHPRPIRKHDRGLLNERVHVA